MTLKLDLRFLKTKSHTKFQLNMSRNVGEKCGKLADGDPDGRSEIRTDGRRPRGMDITLSLYVSSEDGRIKTDKTKFAHLTSLNCRQRHEEDKLKNPSEKLSKFRQKLKV